MIISGSSLSEIVSIDMGLEMSEFSLAMTATVFTSPSDLSKNSVCFTNCLFSLEFRLFEVIA